MLICSDMNRAQYVIHLKLNKICKRVERHDGTGRFARKAAYQDQKALGIQFGKAALPNLVLPAHKQTVHRIYVRRREENITTFSAVRTIPE